MISRLEEAFSGLPGPVRVALSLASIPILIAATILVALALPPQQKQLYLPGDFVVSLAWSRDGSLIATSSDYNRLTTIWSADGTLIKQIRRATGSCSLGNKMLAFASDNTRLYTARQPNDPNLKVALSILDWQAGVWVEDVPSLPLPAEYDASGLSLCAKDFKVSPDNKFVVYIFGTYDHIALQSLNEAFPIQSLIKDYAKDMQWSPDAKEIALIDGTLKIRSVPDLSVLLSIRPFDEGSVVNYSSDGRFLAAGRGPKSSGPDYQSVRRFGAVQYPHESLIVIDRRSKNAVVAYEIPSLPDNFAITGLAFLKNDDLIVATTDAVYLRPSLRTAPLSRIYSCSNTCYSGISLSPDGRTLGILDRDLIVLIPTDSFDKNLEKGGI